MDNVEIVFEHKAKVLMSKKLLEQIDYLHEHCPKGTEWSGLLIWKLERGSIDNLKELEIRAEAVFPMDYGDSTFTSFEGNEDWISCFQQFPQIDPINHQDGWYIGKIHSHHNMGVFHSGTDKGDLYANAPKLPMFLSLIVNYKDEADCELAISMEIEETILQRTLWKLKGWKKKQKKLEKNKAQSNKTLIIKCEVWHEVDPVEHEEWFKQQCEKLKAAKNKPASIGYQYPGYRNNWEGYNSNGVIDVPKYILDKIRNNFVNLISLGEMYTDRTIKEAVSDIDREVSTHDREKYTKAFKMFFLDTWYPGTFYNTTTTEEKVLDGISIVMKEHNKWIVGVILQAVDELKKELTELWKVQKSSVV